MSEELFTKIPIKDIEEIASKEENKRCFDCNATPANWFCVNNGIFLCASCDTLCKNPAVLLNLSHSSHFSHRFSIQSVKVYKLHSFSLEVYSFQQ